MDRFSRGFISGAVAAVIEFLVAITLRYLNFTEVLWLDFASVLIFGRKPLLFGERVFAELSVWLFAGVAGIIYAYLIPQIGSRNHLFKGFLFGQVVWFGTFAITLLFDVPEFRIITLKSSISNFVEATTWGLLMTEFLHRLDSKAQLK